MSLTIETSHGIIEVQNEKPMVFSDEAYRFLSYLKEEYSQSDTDVFEKLLNDDIIIDFMAKYVPISSIPDKKKDKPVKSDKTKSGKPKKPSVAKIKLSDKEKDALPIDHSHCQCRIWGGPKECGFPNIQCSAPKKSGTEFCGNHKTQDQRDRNTHGLITEEPPSQPGSSVNSTRKWNFQVSGTPNV